MAMQMGGPEGVRQREVFLITLSVEGGMRFLCQPRNAA